MEKSSEVWMGKRIFIPGRKFVEGMALLGDVLAQLEFSPHVIKDIFWMFWVDCIELSFWGGVWHDGADEKLCKSIESVLKGIAGHFKVKISLLLGSVGIGHAKIFGDELD